MGRKVSIIVPIYNKKEYVARAIESLCSQTYKNLEIILINDGSTDGSGLVCEQKAAQDTRIIYISGKNAGPSAARNQGLEIATGDYIAFLDADDFLQTFAIEKMLECMENYQADLVVARQKVISKSDVQITGNINIETGLLTEEQFFKSLANETIGVFWGSQGNKLYSQKLISNHHLRFELGRDHAEDFLFNLEYYKRSLKIAFLNEVTYEIYDVPASLSKQSDIKELAVWGEDAWRSLTCFYKEHFQEKYLPWVDAVFCKVIRGAIMTQRTNGQLSLKNAHRLAIYYAKIPWIAECIKNAQSNSAKQQVAIQCFRMKAYWILAILYCITEK